MKQRIFRSVLLAAILTAAVSVVSVFFLFFSLMENELLQEMSAEAELLKKGVLFGGEEYLQSLADEERRVTVIGRDGTVLFDSGSDIGSMDNHLEREEIREALSEGKGSSIRYSNTLTKTTIYYATMLDDDRILRLSVDQNYVMVLLSWLIPPIGILLVGIVVLSAFLSRNVTKRILTPLYRIDLEHPENSSEVYEELRPLTDRIHLQNRKLKEKVYGELLDIQKRQSEFTANMTHALKTPLTSISGFAELMMEGDMEPENVRDFSKSIYDESKRLISLTEDIILLAEMDEKDKSLRLKEVRVRELVEEIQTALSFGIQEKGLSFYIEGSDLSVRTDERILSEILFNLIDNAVKYNRENGEVRVSFEKTGERTLIRISDTGIGISEEEQGLVFDRFYRARGSEKSIKGSGLGLSIAREGARLLEGDLEICSRENEGTEVTLWIFENKGEEL